MADNPYAPPTAPVADIDQQPYDAQPMFFPVPIWKLLVMLVFTLGFYELYWFYKNWKLIRERDGSNIMPFWRAIFAIFFVYPLFRRMREDGQLHGVSGGFAAGFLAAIWIFARIIWNAPGNVAFFGILGLVVLVIAQVQATAINDAASPGYDRNNRFTPWNLLAVLVLPILILIVGVVAYISAGGMNP
jgi:hypothetical protein